jgi:hypothetical protein
MKRPEKVPNLGATYRRGDLFEKRRRLMNAWAEFFANRPPGYAKIVTLRAKLEVGG